MVVKGVGNAGYLILTIRTGPSSGLNQANVDILTLNLTQADKLNWKKKSDGKEWSKKNV